MGLLKKVKRLLALLFNQFRQLPRITLVGLAILHELPKTYGLQCGFVGEDNLCAVRIPCLHRPDIPVSALWHQSRPISLHSVKTNICNTDLSVHLVAFKATGIDPKVKDSPFTFPFTVVFAVNILMGDHFIDFVEAEFFEFAI